MNRATPAHGSVQIPVRNGHLTGDLNVPEEAGGIVVFAHGSGSSRHSPRNRFVAGELNSGGLATLLVDLLTGPEEWMDQTTAQLRFDIPFLADRLVVATDLLQSWPGTRKLAVGYFGASTGGGAALAASAILAGQIKAVVSRGGRPDLASDALPHVQSPTLLIVGGRDHVVIELNRDAMQQLRCEKKLEIVPGATHLFEEPGALKEVARLAREWFVEHLVQPMRHEVGT